MKELLSYSIWVLAWLPVGFIVDFPLTGVMGWFSALFMYKQGYWLWGGIRFSLHQNLKEDLKAKSVSAFTTRNYRLFLKLEVCFQIKWIFGKRAVTVAVITGVSSLVAEH